MFKRDIDKVNELHQKYQFKGPLLDAGGLESPTIADYEISKQKAIVVSYVYDGQKYTVTVPHPMQNDRYTNIKRPWKFIEENYTILNPEYGDPYIENLPDKYKNTFNSVIMVSVLEHVDNPFEVCAAVYEILKPGGYFFNSTPFIFPHHPSPNDNYRYSPNGLKIVHEKCGFIPVEQDFHVWYGPDDGIGDTNPKSYGAIQTVVGSYIFCQKPWN